MKLNKNNKIRIGIVIGISILVLLFMFPSEKELVTAEGNWNISNEVNEAGYEQYLIEEPDFDYSTPSIFNLAKQIKESTSSPEEAIKKTIKHVATNVRYSSAITINYCYSETASKVAEVKEGDCVSMSRLVTALLRAQGIPTKTVGGCLTTERCDILFSTVPLLETQTTLMSVGDFKKRGFLHEWAETWTPEKGWMVVEATAGRLYSTDCDTYLFYSYDSNSRNRCIINDMSFWNQCRVS